MEGLGKLLEEEEVEGTLVFVLDDVAKLLLLLMLSLLLFLLLEEKKRSREIRIIIKIRRYITTRRVGS